MKFKPEERRVVCLEDPMSLAAESYRTLRTNIQYAAVNREIRSLMVTSADPGEGKTTTAVNLAVVMVQTGKRVLLIDCDLRKSSVHHYLGLKNRVGVSQLLIRQATPPEAVQQVGSLALDVITAGPTPPNPAEMIGSQRMQDLLAHLKGQYDLVVIDSPPLLAVTDAQLLAGSVEGVLLVLRSGKVQRERALKAKSLLERVDAPLIGALLNHKKLDHGDQAYYYAE